MLLPFERGMFAVTGKVYPDIFENWLMPQLADEEVQGYCTLRVRLKRDGTRAETKFSLSAKRTSPFKLPWASVQSTTGSRGVRISGSNGSNAGYTVFRGTVQDYWLPTPLACSPSLPLPCVTLCHQVSTELYQSLLVGRNSESKEQQGLLGSCVRFF